MTAGPEELPPLDADIAALLASAERAPPSHAALRLRHHIRRRVGATLAGGAMASAAVAATANSTATAAAAAQPAVASLGEGSGLATLILGKAKVALVVVACAGAATVGYGYMNRAGERGQAPAPGGFAPPLVEAPGSAKLPEQPAELAPPLPVPPSPKASVAVSRKGSSRAAPSDALLEEQRLLAAARSASAMGDAARALAHLHRHELAYPRGKLVEEREAMAVRVLVRLGRLPQARERARAFVHKYPQSIQRAVVEATLQVAPAAAAGSTGTAEE